MADTHHPRSSLLWFAFSAVPWSFGHLQNAIARWKKKDEQNTWYWTKQIRKICKSLFDSSVGVAYLGVQPHCNHVHRNTLTDSLPNRAPQSTHNIRQSSPSLYHTIKRKKWPVSCWSWVSHRFFMASLQSFSLHFLSPHFGIRSWRMRTADFQDPPLSPGTVIAAFSSKIEVLQWIFLQANSKNLLKNIFERREWLGILQRWKSPSHSGRRDATALDKWIDVVVVISLAPIASRQHHSLWPVIFAVALLSKTYAWIREREKL